MSRLMNFLKSIPDRFCYGLAKPPMKETCSEFLATFVLVVIGNGVMATCVLGGLNSISVLVGAFGWGFALMIAVSIAGGVSGGHVNPAVTVALATVKKCQWKQVFPFVVAQYIASFCAAAVVYLIYIDALSEFDGGVRQLPPSINATAQIFATYPQEFASLWTCIWDQIIGTALLLIVICAATDVRNLRVPPHTQPILIGLGLTGIIFAFGHNCGAPLNPARDFSPRLLTALSGWGMEVFSYRNYEWFWIPIVIPHVGGIVGVWIYVALIELPFRNYGRFLEEMEQLQLERSSSSEDGTYKRMLERAETQDLKAEQGVSSILSQRKAKADASDNV